MPDSIAASPISAHTRKQVTLTAASVLSSRAARIVRHPCRSSFLQAFQVAESKLDPSLGGGCHVLLLVLCETLPDLPKVIGATCARRLDRALGSGEWLRCHRCTSEERDRFSEDRARAARWRRLHSWQEQMMKEPVPADMTSGGRTSRASLRLAHASSRSTQSAHEDAAHAQSLGRLATLLAAHAPYDGRFALRVPGLFVVRRSRPTRGLERATGLPALCIVAQGAKTVMLGREVYSYDASRLVAYAVDLPIAGKVTQASQREPFLVLVLKLDPFKIAELALKVYPHGVPSPDSSRAVIVGPASTAIVDAAARLVDAMAHPAEAEFLSPAGHRRDPRPPLAQFGGTACRANRPAGFRRTAGGQGGVVGA